MTAEITEKTEETLKQLDENYELIPFSKIDNVARILSVRWIEGYEPMGFDIRQKHKLASDFMNYGSHQVEQFKKELREWVKREQKDICDYGEPYFVIDAKDLSSLLEPKKP